MVLLAPGHGVQLALDGLLLISHVPRAVCGAFDKDPPRLENRDRPVRVLNVFRAREAADGAIHLILSRHGVLDGIRELDRGSE